jgi:hypothetical protein
MAGSKDLRVLRRELERQGFDLKRGGNNHWQVRKDGRLITTLPSTPSDRRGFLNAVATLRRAGFKWEGR